MFKRAHQLRCNLNRVLPTNFRLIFNWIQNISDCADTVATEFFLLGFFHGRVREDVFECGHEWVVEGGEFVGEEFGHYGEETECFTLERRVVDFDGEVEHVLDCFDEGGDVWV